MKSTHLARPLELGILIFVHTSTIFMLHRSGWKHKIGSRRSRPRANEFAYQVLSKVNRVPLANKLDTTMGHVAGCMQHVVLIDPACVNGAGFNHNKSWHASDRNALHYHPCRISFDPLRPFSASVLDSIQCPTVSLLLPPNFFKGSSPAKQ